MTRRCRLQQIEGERLDERRLEATAAVEGGRQDAARWRRSECRRDGQMSTGPWSGAVVGPGTVQGNRSRRSGCGVDGDGNGDGVQALHHASRWPLLSCDCAAARVRVCAVGAEPQTRPPRLRQFYQAPSAHGSSRLANARRSFAHNSLFRLCSWSEIGRWALQQPSAPGPQQEGGLANLGRRLCRRRDRGEVVFKERPRACTRNGRAVVVEGPLGSTTGWAAALYFFEHPSLRDPSASVRPPCTSCSFSWVVLRA